VRPRLYAYAGLGVAVGLAMFGKRVMRTVDGRVILNIE
jgi:phosphate/sulfate permease